MRIKNIFILILTMAVCGFVSADCGYETAVQFPALPGDASGDQPKNIVMRDFNGDGFQDLAFPNQGSDNLSVYIGNGDGTFDTPVHYAAQDVSSAVALGFFNADAIPDLVVANQNQMVSPGVFGTYSIFIGNADGTFQTAVNAGVPNPSFVAVGEFSGDSNADLIFTNAGACGTNCVTLLNGNGDGTFTAPGTSVYNSGASASAIAVGDFNGDTNDDVAVISFGGGVNVLLGTGTGPNFFGAPTPYAAGTGPTAILADFLDADLILDLAVTNNNTDNVSILIGNGNGTFDAAVNYAAGNGPANLIFQDVNGDSNKDIVTANVSGHDVTVLKGNGDGTFDAPVPYPTGGNNNPVGIAAGDLNSDTVPDLVATNFANKNISIFIAKTISVTPNTLSNGVVGDPYSATVMTDGTAPNNFTVTSGSLPDGTNLNAGTGEISGTPTTPGTFNFTVSVTDTNDCKASRAYSVTISPANCPIITVSPASLPNAVPNTAYSETITASGGASPYTYAVTAGALPTGLTLSSGGDITGTPTANGIFNFTVTATDQLLCAANKDYAINVSASLCAGAMFCDDFEDNTVDAAKWTIIKDAFTESGGNFVGTPTGKKAWVTGTGFSGCTNCSFRASIASDGGAFNKIFFYTWFVSKKETVVVLMKQQNNKFVLKQVVNGVTVRKTKGLATINPGQFYDVLVSYDGVNFTLTVDGNQLATMPSASTPTGTTSFAVKNTTGRFGIILVN